MRRYRQRRANGVVVIPVEVSPLVVNYLIHRGPETGSLDRGLLMQAEQAGAEVRLGERVGLETRAVSRRLGSFGGSGPYLRDPDHR